jgi:hypothetical protein
MIIEININFSNQVLDIEANSVSEINIDFKTTQVRVSAVGALQFGGSTQTSGGGEWGQITGDIENQTDLIDYIDNNSGGIESVTGDLVDNTDPANPIVNTPTFNEVLTEGNETDGQDISISDGDQIQFDNYSRIRKGATDAGNGGAKGVALVCSIDYELKWEAGRQYIMQQDGFTIREVSHNFSVTPTVNDDDTKGFVQDSRWILDNGDVYVCTDATESVAVWALQVPSVPTLQQVTDEGSITTNFLTVGDTAGIYSEVGDSFVGTANNTNDTYAYIASDGSLGLGNGTHESTLKNTNVNETGIILEFPDKTAGSYTIATTDEITNGTVTSVGLTMPSAFSVANSPITSTGDIAVTGAGLVSQYVRGDGTLANFPNSTGGGSSVNYYFNGSVSQGTFGGTTYYQMSKTPILGAGTNFVRTNGAGNGYIASFITDAGDPSFLNIPGGNWNLEFYFQASSGGGSPQFYGEIYKVSATNVFTLVASGSANPEGITNGTTIDEYYTSIPVPQTTLLVTDRLAVRIYVITGGRTITLHTENGNLCEILTTFTTGLTALNGLTEQVQNFAVGTSGTDFAISSATATHTFNLPTASATNRGALSSADWSTFNGKQDTITVNNVGTLVNGSAAATPNDTDLVATVESSVLKKITWTNVKAFLKTYFDGLYETKKTVLRITTGDQSVTGSVLVNATGLSCSLDANKTYRVHGGIRMSNVSGGASGVQFAWSIPTAAQSTISMHPMTNLAGGSSINGSAIAIITNNSTQTVAVMGEVKTNANSGTLQFMFATGNANVSILREFSTFIEVWEV